MPIIAKNIGPAGSASTNNVVTEGVSTLPFDYNNNPISVNKIRFVVNYSGAPVSVHGRTFAPGFWDFQQWAGLPLPAPISSGGSIGVAGTVIGYCQ